MHLFHLLSSFAKAGFLRITGVLSSRLLPAIHWRRHPRYYVNFLKKFYQKPVCFFGQAFFLKERLRVNGTGGILTLWLTKLRGTPPPRNEFRGIPLPQVGFQIFYTFLI